jgi:putative glycosyltransferase (TIGR04372 family)
MRICYKNFRKKLFNVFFNVSKEGLYPYFSRRVSKPISKAILVLRKIRYQLVGLLHGHVFYPSITELFQLELFCTEISERSALFRASLQNIEVQSLAKQSREHLFSGFLDESLSLLDEMRTLAPHCPNLPDLYQSSARFIYEEIGVFGNLWEKATLAAIESKKKQYEGYFCNLSSTKILDSTWTGAIGHLGVLAVFIKAKQLGLLPKKDDYTVLANNCANPCYLDYLKSCNVITILENDIRGFGNFNPLNLESMEIWEMKDGYQNLNRCVSVVEQKWKLEMPDPLLRIKEEHREKGFKILEKLGVPRGSFFVSLHVRDGSTGRNGLRNGRNCDINSYVPAIKSITECGGYVFRMGDRTMKPLPEMPQVIDYAISPYKSDWMDVFLWACSRFFVSTTSGPNMIPPTFGVPQLWTNAVSFGSLPQLANTLLIPKLWYSQAKQRLLTFSEMLGCPAGWCERPSLGDDLVLVDNSAEELEAGVREMLELTRDGIREFEYGLARYTSNPLQIRLDETRERYKACGKLLVSYPFLNGHADLIN